MEEATYIVFKKNNSINYWDLLGLVQRYEVSSRKIIKSRIAQVLVFLGVGYKRESDGERRYSGCLLYTSPSPRDA